MMLLSLLWHTPLRNKHNTDNFTIKLIYKHLDPRKVCMKKTKAKQQKKKCYLKNIQKRRRHFRYVQNQNDTQIEVDMHHDSVPFQ